MSVPVLPGCTCRTVISSDPLIISWLIKLLLYYNSTDSSPSIAVVKGFCRDKGRLLENQMYFPHGIFIRVVLDCAEVAYVSEEDSARFSTCSCVCVCPLALQWVTLGIEFHRSGSAGATRETCKLAALSGGWNQLEADACVQTPVSFAPCVRSSLPR